MLFGHGMYGMIISIPNRRLSRSRLFIMWGGIESRAMYSFLINRLGCAYCLFSFSWICSDSVWYMLYGIPVWVNHEET